MATGGETQVFIYPKTNLKTHCQWLKAKTNGGSNALVSFDSAIMFIEHFYERFSKHAKLLHKKMTSLLVFGVSKDQVSARHEIWNSLLHEGGLTSHNFWTQTFSLYQAKSCGYLDLHLPGSALYSPVCRSILPRRLGTRAVPISRSVSRGLSTSHCTTPPSN